LKNIMPKFVYIDNPSLWAEGRRASAVKKGKACDILDSIENNISDMEWSCDVGKLLTLIGCTKENTKKAYLFGCYPPMSDSLWNEDIRCFLTTMNYWIRNPVDIVIQIRTLLI